MNSDRRPVAGDQPAREDRFRRLYADHARQVLSYALRRTGDREAAADVVADTFLVAWRRLDEVPGGDKAQMWLYGVARRVLANQQRGERRRHRLAEQLARELTVALDARPALEPQASPLRDALAGLSSEDQELLRLAAWEELNPGQIAAVLGVTQIAVRSRLHRARKRLRARLDQASAGDAFDPLNVQEAL